MSQNFDHPGGKPRRLDPDKLLQAAASADPGSDPRPDAWQPPAIDEVRRRFAELEVTELVGRGGMGAVYRAVQVRLGRTVALKILPPQLAAEPAFEERFLREARALAGLQHPRILAIHDFGERDGLFYLITEFVAGMTLRELMNMGELSPAEALRLTPQICEALQFAHDHGVVHRDIKPENLLVDRQGDVKLVDFGLARILGEPPGAALTRSTQLVGTPHYMAPEQWRHGGAVDHRVDIYAVGVVLYEMLTGNLPLGHFDPPSHRPGVPPGLDAVVQRSLAQQPEQRYQRASDVGDDVQRQRLDSQRAGPPPIPPAGTDARGASVRAQLITSWLIAIVMVLAGHGSRGYDAASEQSFLPAAEGLVLSTVIMMLCGSWAIRRIQKRRQGTKDLAFAIVTKWIVPLGIATMLPFTVTIHAVSHHPAYVAASTGVSILIGLAGIAWMIRYHRRLSAELA